MNFNSLSRRDFLKVLGTVFCSQMIGSQPVDLLNQMHYSGDRPNVFIFVFDSWSARHVSLQGYPRQTTPNLTEFAANANVYHRHYAGGNFTSPGTATLLTGTYPWTNRCTQLNFGVLDHLTEHNLFSLMGSKFHTYGYTQNFGVQTLFSQFREQLSESPPIDQPGTYYFFPKDRLFANDYNTRFYARRVMHGIYYPPASQPVLTNLYNAYYNYRQTLLLKAYEGQYPRGLSAAYNGVYIILDEAISWVRSQIESMPKPALAYFHMWAPHFPYTPHKDFVGMFEDTYLPPQKPEHIFSDHVSRETLLAQRMAYDEFVANVDSEIGKLIGHLKEAQLYEDSYIVITSDHGELFERGISGHTTNVLYESLDHIPLLIKKPGQTGREDIFSPTSAADIVPTLCQLFEVPIPDWVEGAVLPGFDGHQQDEERSIVTVEMKQNSKFKPFTIGTVAQVKWPYKLIYYRGFEELDEVYELYNLLEDQEELVDLAGKEPAVLKWMRDELLTRLEEKDKPFLKPSPV